MTIFEQHDIRRKELAIRTRPGLRSLIGTLCGACIVTLPVLCLGVAPALAQPLPTATTIFIVPNSVVQGQFANVISQTIAAPPPPELPVPVTSGTVTFFRAGLGNIPGACGPPNTPTGGGTLASNLPVSNGGAAAPLDTSIAGTFGYSASYNDGADFAPSPSPCVDLVVIPACTGVTIAADLAGGNGMPLAGTINEQFTVRIRVHACQAATNLKVQGGTNGWATNTIATNPSPNPTVGTTAVKNNKVITWTINSLAAGSDADLYLTIDGTIKANTTPGTILGLTGPWSVVYSLDFGTTFQTSSYTGAVTVTVMPSCSAVPAGMPSLC